MLVTLFVLVAVPVLVTLFVLVTLSVLVTLPEGRKELY